MVGMSEQLYDDRAHVYHKSGDLLVAIARHHHGLHIDNPTHERWRQLMGLMREVDTWLDDSPVTPDEVITELDSFEQFENRYPDLTASEVGAENHENMVKRAALIAQIGERVMCTPDVSEFIGLRIQEAEETVNLLGDTATERVKTQPEFDTEFLPTIRALGAAATLFDSLIDGRRDVKEGKQIIRPNWRYYKEVGLAMKDQGKIGGPALLHPAPWFHIGVKGIERSVNRVKNGMKSYSNLNILGRYTD